MLKQINVSSSMQVIGLHSFIKTHLTNSTRSGTLRELILARTNFGEIGERTRNSKFLGHSSN